MYGHILLIYKNHILKIQHSVSQEYNLNVLSNQIQLFPGPCYVDDGLSDLNQYVPLMIKLSWMVIQSWEPWGELLAQQQRLHLHGPESLPKRLWRLIWTIHPSLFVSPWDLQAKFSCDSMMFINTMWRCTGKNLLKQESSLSFPIYWQRICWQKMLIKV